MTQQTAPEEDVSKRLIIEGEWMAEIVELTLRKVPLYGLPYTAVATVKIVDGKAHVINLLSKEGTKMGRKDVAAVRKIIEKLGVITINFRRYQVSFPEVV